MLTKQERAAVLLAMADVSKNFTYSCHAIQNKKVGGWKSEASGVLLMKYWEFFKMDHEMRTCGMPLDHEHQQLRLTMLALFLAADGEVG